MNFGIGCIVRAAPTIEFSNHTLKVREVPLTDAILSAFDEYDELISNIISIEADQSVGPVFL